MFVCALGDVHYKQKYVEIIKTKGGEFISLEHPSVEVETNVKIGVGCIIRGHSTISCDVTIGNLVTIMGFCVTGHDAKVGGIIVQALPQFPKLRSKPGFDAFGHFL